MTLQPEMLFFDAGRRRCGPTSASLNTRRGSRTADPSTASTAADFAQDDKPLGFASLRGQARSGGKTITTDGPNGDRQRSGVRRLRPRRHRWGDLERKYGEAEQTDEGTIRRWASEAECSHSAEREPACMRHPASREHRWHAAGFVQRPIALEPTRRAGWARRDCRARAAAGPVSAAARGCRR